MNGSAVCLGTRVVTARPAERHEDHIARVLRSAEETNLVHGELGILDACPLQLLL